VKTIQGCYGSNKTACHIFVYDGWYAVEGSRNVNRACDPGTLVDGVWVEAVEDCDTFTWSEGIHSELGLQEAVEN